jgi:hypothetical protein
MMRCEITRLIPFFSGSGYRGFWLVLAFLGVCTLFLSLLCHGAGASSDEVVAEVPPAWLKVGTYVEYLCGLSDWSSKEAEGRFRWECISLSNHVATLNFTSFGFFINGITIFEKKTIGYIDMNTRDLLYSNGTVMGKTALWLPPYMKLDEKVAVCGKAPNESIAECFFSGGGSAHTCQGYQESYLARTQGSDIHYTSGGFDMDTGICLDGIFGYLGYLGFGEVDLLLQLTATNVDLGPRYLRTEILMFLFTTMHITIPIIVITLIAVILYRKRRKHKKKLQEQSLKPHNLKLRCQLSSNLTGTTDGLSALKIPIILGSAGPNSSSPIIQN